MIHFGAFYRKSSLENSTWDTAYFICSFSPHRWKQQRLQIEIASCRFPPGPRSHGPRPRSISPALRADHAEGFLEIISAANPAAGIPARIMFRNPARSAVPPRWRTFGKLLDKRAAVLTRVTGGTQTQRGKNEESTYDRFC